MKVPYYSLRGTAQVHVASHFLVCLYLVILCSGIAMVCVIYDDNYYINVSKYWLLVYLFSYKNLINLIVIYYLYLYLYYFTGRTDFPGGSQSQIKDSIINTLFKLPDETRVIPGHNDETTIGREKKTNMIKYSWCECEELWINKFEWS